MYAIVNIAGQQFKVEKGQKIFVHRLTGNVGDDVSFDKVMLISNDDRVNIGSPYIQDAVVLAEIVSHLRGDKVLVFKKKRRKTYQKLNGHRQNFTEILIEDISETGTPKKSEKKKVTAPKAENANSEDSDAAKEVKAATKESSKKGSPKSKVEEKAKKPAAKKSAEKKPAAKSTAKGKSDKSKK